MFNLIVESLDFVSFVMCGVGVSLPQSSPSLENSAGILINWYEFFNWPCCVLATKSRVTLTWKTWKSRGIPEWSGKSQGKLKKSGKLGKWLMKL